MARNWTLEKWKTQEQKKSELQLSLVASLAQAHPEIEPKKIARSVRDTLDKIDAMAARIATKRGAKQAPGKAVRRKRRRKQSAKRPTAKTTAE